MGASLGRPWSQPGLFVAIATSCALAGCSPFGSSAFTCETNEQCGANGRCEELTKLCSFPDLTGTCPGGWMYGEHAGPRAGDCASGDAPPIIDAPIDAPPPAQCEANERICFGSAIETCKPSGQGYDPALRVECALACDSSTGTPRCLAASLIPVSEQLACGGADAIDLQAQPDSEITIRDNEITCEGCAGGVTSIPRRGTTPNHWFCLKSLVLPAGVEIEAQNTGPVSLFVAGTTQIEATFDFAGRGPGSYDGANGPPDNSAGSAGQGPCAGGAGGRAGAGTAFVGGGGGGAGGAGTGGTGGDGKETAGAVATGGPGGPTGDQCDAASVIPLRGGSGGGSGGDGSCGATIACGGAGGDGGGAIHIASRADIVGGGSINVSGEAGQGTNIFNQGGGGGGGAGGAVLLEAARVALTGSLLAHGGNGGASGLRPGGPGASGGSLQGTNGRNGISNGDGGSGAGGAAGRIRINSLQPASCSNAQPQPACSTGPLPLQ